MDTIKELYEKDIKANKIIEELVCLGMKTKLQDLAYKMANVTNKDELKVVIEETKNVQEAVKMMLENHERTIDIYNEKYKGE